MISFKVSLSSFSILRIIILFLAVGIEYPFLSRVDLEGGFVRNLSVLGVPDLATIPFMAQVDGSNDYSFAMICNFDLVALTRKISVHGSGVCQTAFLTPSHLVSDVFFMDIHVLKNEVFIFILGCFTYSL